MHPDSSLTPPALAEQNLPELFGSLPDPPSELSGTEFAEWCAQADARQAAFAQHRRMYRERMVAPALPVELQKPGRPR